jgi:hypothetical protein
MFEAIREHPRVLHIPVALANVWLVKLHDIFALVGFCKARLFCHLG